MLSLMMQHVRRLIGRWRPMPREGLLVHDGGQGVDDHLRRVADDGRSVVWCDGRPMSSVFSLIDSRALPYFPWAERARAREEICKSARRLVLPPVEPFTHQDVLLRGRAG